MPNERQATLLSETRAAAAQLDDAIDALESLRERFNAIGGEPEFKGAGKLFLADGSGQEITYDTFLGNFNALGALEGTAGTPVAAWDAFKAILEKTRG